MRVLRFLGLLIIWLTVPWLMFLILLWRVTR